jgi:hypothetical protein
MEDMFKANDDKSDVRLNRKLLTVGDSPVDFFEQRQYPRCTSYIIAEYTVEEGTFRDIIQNINAGGLFIGTDREIAAKQTIFNKFPLFDFQHIVEVKGKIVRKDANGFAVAFNKPIKQLICKKGNFPRIVHELDR